MFFDPQILKRIPLTLVLIAISVLVALITQLGAEREMVYPFLISEYMAGLVEIRQGQVWRLVTPIFLHFGWLHIIFNMLWLYDLGGAVEIRQGRLVLLALVLGTGVTANLGQYWFSGPLFGGMSGVVYGLLGYVWMQGRYNPRAGLVLHQQIVAMMLIWFALGWVGLIPGIANMAHTVGLLVGLVAGGLYRPR